MNIGEMQRLPCRKAGFDNRWRARCGESRTPGSEGGVGKPAYREDTVVKRHRHEQGVPLLPNVRHEAR
jgi:hypothetical protein